MVDFAWTAMVSATGAVVISQSVLASPFGIDVRDIPNVAYFLRFTNGQESIHFVMHHSALTGRPFLSGMARAIAVMLLWCAQPTNAQAQNLIRNPSFEEIDESCEGILGYSDIADWILPQCAIGGTYFNECSTLNGYPNTGVPLNAWGYQGAFEGQAYAATTTFVLNASFPPSYYLSTPLYEPLSAGVEYCFSVHVALAEVSAYRTHDLHVVLTSYFPTTCNGNDTANWTSEAQLILNTSEVDTASWSELSGSFIATGGEEYITLGDFNGQGSADTVYVGPTAFPSPRAIYYVDDLELRTCESAVAENTEGDLLVAYDAHAGLLNITAPREDQLERITLVDMAGRTVVQVPRSSSPARLNVSALPYGVYVVQAAVKGTVLSRRVVIH